MAMKPKLDADLSGNPVDQTDYRSKIRGTIDMGLWYPKDSGFELTAFLDVDHAGCIDTRKRTSGGIQFLGCAQVMWMRTQFKDYGFNYNKIPLYYASQSAIPRSDKESPKAEIDVDLVQVNSNEEEEESAEEMLIRRRRKKGKGIEEARNSTPPTPIRSPRTYNAPLSTDKEKL
nr:hypothetical protein [Tanacetum cinerariifolium]